MGMRQCTWQGLLEPKRQQNTWARLSFSKPMYPSLRTTELHPATMELAGKFGTIKFKNHLHKLHSTGCRWTTQHYSDACACGARSLHDQRACSARGINALGNGAIKSCTWRRRFALSKRQLGRAKPCLLWR